MSYVVYVNDLGNIGYFRQVVGTPLEYYTAKWPNAIIVDSIPNEEYSDCFEIVNGEVVIGDSVLTKLKNQLTAAINEDVLVKKYANITVGGNEFNVNAETLIYLNSAVAPVDWILSDNSTVELSAQNLSDLIAAISNRTTALVVDGRRKKDLVLAMTTIEQLEAVDIDAL